MKRILFALTFLLLTSAYAAEVIDGVDVPEFAHFDTAMINFMEQHDVSDGQIAISWQGRLVFARTYTHNSDSPTSNTSRYRIASVSKPLTSTLVHRAHQDGLLSLDDPISQYLDISPMPGKTADPRLANVTIRHLLQHLAGFGGQAHYGIDPAFNDYVVASATGEGMPVLKTQVLRYMNGLDLIHEPGSTTDYSNYGYMLLGMVLETASGLPYGAYADQVLNPTGIYNARQARSQKHRRYPGEAVYNSVGLKTTVMDNSGAIASTAYDGHNWENSGAFGAWTISAVEMVRWLSNLDAPDAPNAILNADTRNMMFAPPENFPLPYNYGDAWYSSGWSVQDFGGDDRRNSLHSGSLAGTSSHVVRLFTGLTYAFVINERNEDGGEDWHGEIANFMQEAINQITVWPTHDLFETYLRAQPEAAGARYDGSWYDVSHNGEGFTISIINPSTAVIYWFTYDREGKQRWYVGIARLDGHRMIVDSLLESRGGKFGPDFNPADVVKSEVGSLVINFFDDGNAKVDYLLKGESGYMNLSRLTTPFSSDNPAAPTDNWRNGLWYDPTHDGEGYVVEVLQNGTIVIYWFTYDKDGHPAWMVGSVTGATLQEGAEIPLSLPEGGNFGVSFNPDNVNFASNGSAIFQMRCDGASSAEYSGGDNRFAEVTLILQRLATYISPPCP